MLQTLLSPLTSRLPLTPRPGAAPSLPPVDDTAAAEDFARDVLVEVMRNAVERLKLAEGLQPRTQVLVEIHGIMTQDGCTKDVFREMDGFLVLMSVLSTIQPAHSWAVAVEGDMIVHEVLEAVRLVFAIISEAMDDHKENATFFERSVGYESLAQSVIPLVSDPKTVEQTLGFLAALALHNFSLSGVFIETGKRDYAAIDSQLQNAEPMFKTIRHPGALRVLHSSLEYLPPANAPLLRYSVLKLFERLVQHSHRNHAVLASLNLVGSLFEIYYASVKGRAPEDADADADEKPEPTTSKQERHVIVRLLKRLLELGFTTEDARIMFQRSVKSDDTLDIDVLELLRAGLKNRWPEHLSLEGPSALTIPEEHARGLPHGGFTFMIWVRIESFPVDKAQSIFAFRLGQTTVFSLNIRPGGNLTCQSIIGRDIPPFKPMIPLQLNRWTHITLVHYPHRASNPTVRLYFDGVLCDVLQLSYPKTDGMPRSGLYVIGDPSETAQMSWCIASAHFLSIPVGDDVPRFIQHLGPRYAGRFQSADLVKYLTYEASTSLNIFLASVAQSKKTTTMGTLISRGLGINAGSVVFNLTPSVPGSKDVGLGLIGNDEVSDGLPALRVEGDVVAVRNVSLDVSIWRLGGSAVPLRLVQLATVRIRPPFDLFLSLMIFRLRMDFRVHSASLLAAYATAGKTQKTWSDSSDLINLTSFETLFEFLGLNFRSPDQSTVINTAAYRAIALDLQLWSRTKPDIQNAYFQHFVTLLQKSKFKRFNATQRLGKMSVVRKLLFALQTDYFHIEAVPSLIETLRLIAQSHLSLNGVFKPLVQYLAANLHTGESSSLKAVFVRLNEIVDMGGVGSPNSISSRIDLGNARYKAELTLQMFVGLLRSQDAFKSFASSLPYTSICLLLLGDRPSPAIALEVLHMVELGMNFIPSFVRKFELASGWSVLKNILPHAWTPTVQAAAFHILMGYANTDGKGAIMCPHILPAILSALQGELNVVAGISLPDNLSEYAIREVGPAQAAESLLEQLIELQATNAAFRQTFQIQTTTLAFINAYRSFVVALASSSQIDQATIRILEKLSHFGLTLSLDENVQTAQKQEILDILHSAEAVLNPLNSQQSYIDPSVIVNRKPRNRRTVSMRLSVHLGQKAAQKSTQKIYIWRKKITATEQKRLRKSILDLREQRRQISVLTEWTESLTTERGLWPRPDSEWKWRLDETEGPYRVRKKLEHLYEKSAPSKVDSGAEARHIQEPSLETPASAVEMPPWAESYGFSADAEEHHLEDEVVEDKHRRVRHELEPGDVIEAAETVARVFGVDSSPGLLILGRTHFYMLDGLVENDNGEVVDARDAPKRIFCVPGSIVELNGPQRAQRWSYDQVASFSDRTFLFRDVGLEIYFKDSRSLLVVFLEKTKRQAITDRLGASNRRLGDNGLTPSLLKSPMVSKLSATVSARVSATIMSFRPDELATAQRRWQARELSNFSYLSILNQVSGRTPSDATHLSKPMGALTPARREDAESRYANLKSVGEVPFHYGTHFSSSMIVCHFLIRMEPFTHMFKTLQGGDWDLPDRLFSDMKRAYESASQDPRGDVRELIPEFFNCPEFLENSANLDFGVLQNTGERIHDVKLPLWAKSDPLLFIYLNRRALESDYVSRSLPAWIDLIWGCKQRDPEALNCFHPLSYEGSVDLDKITDDLEREASVGIIHNFGQTPRKLFHTPHPDRMMHGTSSLPIGTIYGIAEDYNLLSQGHKVVRDIGQPVTELAVDLIGERIIPCSSGTLAVPSHPHEILEWDPPHYPASEMRLVIDRKVVQVIEDAFCSCASFPDPDTVVTGSTDFTVRLWRMVRGPNNPTRIEPTHIMRGHTAAVSSVTASRAWSLAVSGSKDGSAGFWDLNRGIYVRSVRHGHGPEAEVHLVAIHESTGHIASCSRDKLWLHTVNARPIAVLDLRDGAMSPKYPPLTALSFHEREYTPVWVLATGSPDGTISLRTWNADDTPDGEKAIWEFVTLKKLRLRTSGDGPESRASVPCVTSLRFIGETLFHGEDTGRVFAWELPD
ncbi:hypothetical protein EIP86_003752 [Pleurotus ostreatoroseus]|nr:hypothetical protein EIP86_003752 [Pleurotus ostreatoroseus]